PPGVVRPLSGKAEPPAAEAAEEAEARTSLGHRRSFAVGAAHASRFVPEGRPAARQPCGRALRGLDSRPFLPRVLSGRHERTQPRKEHGNGQEQRPDPHPLRQPRRQPGPPRPPRPGDLPPRLRSRHRPGRREDLRPGGTRVPHLLPRRLHQGDGGASLDPLRRLDQRVPPLPEGRPGAPLRLLSDPHLREGRRDPALPAVRRQDRHSRAGQDPTGRGRLSILRAPGLPKPGARPVSDSLPPTRRAGTFLLAARLAALPLRWSSPAGGRQGNPRGAGVPPGLDRRRRGGGAARLVLPQGPRENVRGESLSLAALFFPKKPPPQAMGEQFPRSAPEISFLFEPHAAVSLSASPRAGNKFGILCAGRRFQSPDACDTFTNFSEGDMALLAILPGRLNLINSKLLKLTSERSGANQLDGLQQPFSNRLIEGL